MRNINRRPRNKRPNDKNNLPHGEWFLYYNNGQLEYRWNFIHGIAHGLDEAYHEDGTIRYRGYKNMDKNVGYWIFNSQRKYYYLWLI